MKLFANALDYFRRRRPYIIERVIDPKLLPFVASHLVKRQHVNSLNIPELSRECGELLDIVFVVRQPRHQHVAQPDRFPTLRQPARKIQCWTIIFSRQVLMARRIP